MGDCIRPTRGASKYRWEAEVNVLAYPAPIIDLARLTVYFIAFLYPVLAVYHFIDEDWEFDGKWLFSTAQTMVLLALAVIVFIAVFYYLWHIATGWRYVYMFEMDPTGVVIHYKPKVRQGKFARKVLDMTGALTAMTSDETSLSDAAIGSEQMYKVDFDNVRSITVKRNHRIICLNELVSKNRIYVEDREDYDFVLKYISKCCPR